MDFPSIQKYISNIGPPAQPVFRRLGARASASSARGTDRLISNPARRLPRHTVSRPLRLTPTGLSDFGGGCHSWSTASGPARFGPRTSATIRLERPLRTLWFDIVSGLGLGNGAPSAVQRATRPPHKLAARFPCSATALQHGRKRSSVSPVWVGQPRGGYALRLNKAVVRWVIATRGGAASCR